MATSLQFPSFDAAITNAEGYGTPNYAYPNANNPMDLMPGGVEATYPTVDAGLQAGDSMLSRISQGLSGVYSPNETLAQFGSTYSGGDPNFANNVGASLGVPVTTPLSQIFSMTAANGGETSSSGAGLSNLDTVLQQMGTYAGPGGMTLNEIAALGGAQNAPLPGAQVTSSAASFWSLWDPARWAIAIVGLGLIGAGLLLFKSSSIIIDKGISAGRAAATIV